jgi:tetratricopeptide (TPR) repeat protein
MPGGRLQVLPFSWDARPKAQGGQRWFDIYANQTIGPKDPLFWTKPLQNWNMQCAQCHSTNLKKNYNPKTGTYHTTFAEIDVSCESCHGPGSAHVAWAARHKHNKNAAGGAGNMGLLVDLSVKPYRFVHDPKTNLPRRTRALASRTLIHVCAKCHARRTDLTDHPGLGRSLLQTHQPELLEQPAYFADGQIHGEDYVWGSFTQSVMYHHGVRCVDCHNAHTMKLRAPAKNGKICLTCHAAKHVATLQHTHHRPGSAGANCINCHMPERNFMRIDRRFDHSIRIPRPDLSVKYTVPNACTRCHAGKTNRWAAKWTKKWYGSLKTTPPSFVRALAAGRNNAPDASRLLNKAARQPAYPAIARATAAEMLRSYPSAHTARTIESLLHANNPLLRLGAARALTGFAPGARWQLGAGLLRDKVLAVRIAAAGELAPESGRYAKGADATAFSHALADLFRTQRHNADRPSSLIEHGNVELALKHPAKAKKAYQRAIAREPADAAAYVNLADLYRQQHQEAKVQQALHRGLAATPSGANLHYALALSDVRLGRRDKAIDQLKRSVALAPDNTQYPYTYAVALNSFGQPRRAIRVLTKALKHHPHNTQLLVAVTTIARDQGDRATATHYARRLARLAPGNAQFQQLLRSLVQ